METLRMDAVDPALALFVTGRTLRKESSHWKDLVTATVSFWSICQ